MSVSDSQRTAVWKKLIPILAALFCAVLISACSVPFIGGRGEDGEETPEPAPEPTPEPMDLTGEWYQSNSHSEGNFQGLYISEDYMEIYWILGESEGAALYWAGTFTPPAGKTAEETYEWKSAADTSRTALSLLTDKNNAKTFTYENGKISYKVDYEDVAMTVKAERGVWGHDGLSYYGTIDMFDLVNGVYRAFIAENPAGGN